MQWEPALKELAVILVSCALASCVANSDPWPAAGTGGFAEWGPIYDVRLQALNDRLEAARAHGAETYAAAAYADAMLLLTRCRRELAAELTVDGDADLARLEQQVAAIEAALSPKGLANHRRLS